MLRHSATLADYSKTDTIYTVLEYFERLVQPYPEELPSTPPNRLLAFIAAATKGMRGWIALMALLAGLLGALEAVLFSLLGNLVDLLQSAKPGELWQRHGSMLWLLAGVFAASPFVVGLWALLKHQTLSANFPMRMRWNFHRLMLNQSMSFFQNEFSGRVATKVMQTSLAVRDCVLIVTDILVFVVIYFGTMMAVVGHLDGWLMAPFALWLGLYALALWFFVPRLGRVAQAQADARSLMTGRVTDAYTNIGTVKLFSHSQREASHARQAMEEFMVTARAQMRLVTGFEVTNHTLCVVLVLGTAAGALVLWQRGEVGAGAVAAATAMALRLNGLSHWIMWETSALFEHIGTLEDGMSTLARPSAVKDVPHAKALVVPRGEIVFDRVRFGYGEAKPVIDGFCLRIAPGEKVGLVGRSGAGKSTLVNLLLRFHDVESGRILMDGVDIAKVSQDSLRAQVGMVTQDTSLLHRSVRDNILYGRPDADDAAIVSAAQRAQAHDFIQGLADSRGRQGYDAHVGERGVKLSGGQRQRIAIARVMLKNAPILLLDEATSALDSEVEVAIQSSLYRLMEGKTVVAIAHRLSTIAAMDRLVVIDRGQIVEEGDHNALMARGGLYARLWRHQSGGFLNEDSDSAPATPAEVEA